MTLLRLSPDSDRLRRIARAHAAGELSTPDYRRIRAQVIEAFASGVAANDGDDTQPRLAPRVPPGEVGDAATTPMENVPHRRSAWWYVVVAVALAALAGIAAA